MCICKQKPKKIHQCLICEKHCHTKCLKTKGDIFICPECIFSTFDPLLKPCNIISSPKVIEQNYSYVFKLSSIYFDVKYFFVVKCFRIGEYSQTKYTDLNFPVKCTILINDKLVAEYEAEDKNEPIRKDPPIVLNIFENQKKIFKTGTNLLRFKYSYDYENHIDIQYVFNICICQKVHIDELISKTIKSQCINQYKYREAKNYFLNNFTNFADFEQMENKIDLADPLTQNLIKIPVKGLFCQHLNSFDLQTYLKNFQNIDYRKLVCPLCKSILGRFKIDFQTLILLFEYNHCLAKGYKLSTEVTICNNLDYFFYEEKNQENSQKLTTSSSENIQNQQKVQINTKEEIQQNKKKQKQNIYDFLFDQQLI